MGYKSHITPENILDKLNILIVGNKSKISENGKVITKSAVHHRLVGF